MFFFSIYVSAGAPDDAVHGRSLLSFLSTDAGVYLLKLSAFLSFNSPSSFQVLLRGEKNNGAANSDENITTVGFGFADACASEYSKTKKVKTAFVRWLQTKTI